VPGSYREQIVESDAKRLARERKRYARAWRCVRLVKILGSAGCIGPIILFGCFGLAATVSTVLAVVAACGVLLIPFVAPLVAEVLAKRLRCPGCDSPFLYPLYEDTSVNPLNPLVFLSIGFGRACRECRLPFGYLPTAADLKDDEPSPD
jgi:hypothetical protein